MSEVIEQKIEEVKKEQQVKKVAPIKKRTRSKRKKPILTATLVGDRNFIEKTPYELEMVTGTFTNNDAKKQPINFSHCYDGINFYRKKLKDGEETTVPRYIANHLNNCCYEDVESTFDGHGIKTGERIVMRKRYTFANINF